MPTRVDAALAARLLDPPRTHILCDVDGVVVSGPSVLPGVPEALRQLRRRGKAVRFLTNNASRSRRGLCAALSRHGLEGVTEGDVYNSAYAAARRLRQLLGTAVTAPNGGETQERGMKVGEAAGGPPRRLVHGNLFVIGEAGLHEELRGVLAPGYFTYGLELHDPERVGGFDDDAIAEAWRRGVLPAPMAWGAGDAGGDRRISLAELNAVAVVVGLDRHFSTLKLAYAAMILRGPPWLAEKGPEAAGPHVWFIATNEDPQIPLGPDKVLAPGAGCMVRALATVSGREPDAVCGKPNTDMATILFAEEGIKDPRASCLMIGDRLITDIAFGNAAGCETMLVLNGVEGMREVEAAEREQRSELLPDYIADSLACFIP